MGYLISYNSRFYKTFEGICTCTSKFFWPARAFAAIEIKIASKWSLFRGNYCRKSSESFAERIKGGGSRLIFSRQRLAKVLDEGWKSEIPREKEMMDEQILTDPVAPKSDGYFCICNKWLAERGSKFALALTSKLLNICASIFDFRWFF